MEDLVTGAGLAALGFWVFIACIIVAGVWSSNRKRESEHETLRRIIESGEDLDEQMVDRLLHSASNDHETIRDLRVGAVITLFVAPGMIALGWGLSSLTGEIMSVMMGVSGLLVFISAGLYAAAGLVARGADTESTGNH